MVGWIIQYADETGSYTSEDGPPESAPVRDVTMIAHSTHRRSGSIQHSSEYYVFMENLGRWWGATEDGMLYQLMKDASNVRAVRKGNMRERAPVSSMRKKMGRRPSND